MTSYPTDATSLVPVSEIIARVTSSIDLYSEPFENPNDSYSWNRNRPESLWETWLRTKTLDGQFWPLVETIEREGFVVPVHIYIHGPNWTMGNGHHRVAAAILLVLDKIPVFFTDGDGDGYSWPRVCDPETKRLGGYNAALAQHMHKLLWS